MLESDRLISASPLMDEVQLENVIRPRYLKDYIGQTSAKEQLEIFHSCRS